MLLLSILIFLPPPLPSQSVLPHATLHPTDRWSFEMRLAARVISPSLKGKWVYRSLCGPCSKYIMCSWVLSRKQALALSDSVITSSCKCHAIADSSLRHLTVQQTSFQSCCPPSSGFDSLNILLCFIFLFCLFTPSPSTLNCSQGWIVTLDRPFLWQQSVHTPERSSGFIQQL